MSKPFVSVLVPTYNRRFFIPQLVRNYLKQDYSADRMELVVLDDGTEEIVDLLVGCRNLVYKKLDTRISLGLKRNMTAQLASGDILVQIDDDDIYTETRVSHAVDKLMSTDKLIAGSSLLYVFDVIDCFIYQSGYIGSNHSTDGALAYKRNYLQNNKYADVTIGPESSFTNRFTNPMIQLDPMHAGVCVRHGRNTYPKRSRMITPLSLSNFITDPIELNFYMNEIKYF